MLGHRTRQALSETEATGADHIEVELRLMLKRTHGEGVRLVGVAVTGLAYWQWATASLGIQEPWDAPEYPIFYLGSLGLCALAAYLLPSRPWRWALIIISAQVPIMLLNTAGVGPLAGVGMGVIILQALPAILVATAAARFRKLDRPS